MTTLKECMPPEESWDRFGGVIQYDDQPLAVYLANPSFCRAIWGEYKECNKCKGRMGMMTVHVKPKCNKKDGWIFHSTQAFQILQQEGTQACLDYIYETK